MIHYITTKFVQIENKNTFVYALTAYYDEIWLNERPHDFKLIFSRRYVDDCFVTFRSRDQAKQIHAHFNSRHGNINFIIEYENNKSLLFLDI